MNVKHLRSPAVTRRGETDRRNERAITFTSVWPRLGDCAASPLYEAVIVCDPDPTFVGWKVTEHDASPDVPEGVNVHDEDENDPDPLSRNDTPTQPRCHPACRRR